VLIRLELNAPIEQSLMFGLGWQVHEMAMVSAIQEAQRDNLRSFDSYMLKVVEVSNDILIY